MMNNILGTGFSGGMGGLLALALVWSLFWKGLALWHSARRGEAWWFVALLVFNTLGLLEIVYLFVFAKRTIGDLFTSRV